MPKQDPNYYRQWVAANRDRVLAIKRAYAARNKERVKEIQKAYQQSAAGKLTQRFAIYRHQARARKLAWELPKSEFARIQEGACHYCGKPGPNGLDRIDNTQGYVSGNVVPCCTIHNRMKSNLTLAEFIEACRAVTAHMG